MSNNMRVLIINGFESSKKGAEHFNDFNRTIQSCLRESNHSKHRHRGVGTDKGKLKDHDGSSVVFDFVYKKYNELSEYLVDFGHEMLDDACEKRAIHFDNIDLIILSGDMHCLPWESKYVQVVTLIKMANKAEKPMLCCGGAGFTTVYATCTAGTKYHVLNGPGGDTIDRLASFSRYGSDTGEYPSAFLDNSTGDMYTYDTYRKRWKPVCNVGMYKVGIAVDAHGGSRPNSQQQAEKKFASAADIPPPVAHGNAKEKIAHIHSHTATKAYVDDLMMMNFPVSLVSDCWHLSWSGKLPQRLHIATLAEGPLGPVVLTMKNSLIVACDVQDTPKFAALRKIIVNYLRTLKEKMLNTCDGKISNLALHEYLFGHVEGTGRCRFELEEVSDESVNMQAPPLSVGLTVPSTLPHGPVKALAPVMDLMKARPPADFKVKHVVHKSVQNPKLHRKDRLENLLKKHWCYDPKNVGNNGSSDPSLKQSADQVNKNNFISELINHCILDSNPKYEDEIMPESARDLFSGVYFDESSVSKNRTQKAASDSMKHKSVASSGSTVQNYSSSVVMEGSTATNNSNLMVSLDPSAVHHIPKGVDANLRPNGFGGGSSILKVPAVSGWKEAISQSGSTLQTGAHSQKVSATKQKRPQSGSALPSSTRSQPIETQMAQHHLFVRHPNSARAASKDEFDNPQSTGNGDANALASEHTLQPHDKYSLISPYKGYLHEKAPTVTYISPSKIKSPYNTYRKYVTASSNRESTEPTTTKDGRKLKVPYGGTHKEAWKTEHERESARYQQKKEKFIGGSFKNYFGVASHIPLRQEGGIRPHGQFRELNPHINEVDAAAAYIGGPWKPNTHRPAAATSSTK